METETDQKIAAIDRRRQELQAELKRLREERRLWRYDQAREQAQEKQRARAGRRLVLKQQEPMCYGPHRDSLIPKLVDRLIVYCSDQSRSGRRRLREKLERCFGVCTRTPEYFYQGKFHCYTHAPKGATPLPGVDQDKLATKFQSPNTACDEGQLRQ